MEGEKWVFSPPIRLYTWVLYHISIACDLRGALISGSLSNFSKVHQPVPAFGSALHNTHSLLSALLLMVCVWHSIFFQIAVFACGKGF
jgi:hypothetical protein